jgi:putative transcriptional regulator
MNKLSESLSQGLKEALAYVKKEKIGAKIHKVIVPKKIDVKLIRKNLNLSQNEFASRYGFSVRTLEKWEQGIRQPEGPTRAYLVVIAYNHKAVETALQKQSL